MALNFLKTTDLELLVTRIAESFPCVLAWIEAEAVDASQDADEEFQELNAMLEGITTELLGAQFS